MNQPSPSWLARIAAGPELEEAFQKVQKLEQAHQAAEAERVRLAARLEEVESELKVRTAIMNVTSIVSEADKKGDILSVNEKFIEISKYQLKEGEKWVAYDYCKTCGWEPGDHKDTDLCEECAGEQEGK